MDEFSFTLTNSGDLGADTYDMLVTTAPLGAGWNKLQSEIAVGSGGLSGKPAGVFASGQTQHGGQETTLLSMMLPLLHHGMFLVGVPFTEKSITSTEGGGTPYGASHVARGSGPPRLTDEERATAQALGRRVATLAVALTRAGRGP